MSLDGFLGAVEGGDEGVWTGEGREGCEEGGGCGVEVLVEEFVRGGFGDVVGCGVGGQSCCVC